MNDATARTGETVEDALGRLLAWPTKRVRRDAAILRSRVAELEQERDSALSRTNIAESHASLLRGKLAVLEAALRAIGELFALLAADQDDGSDYLYVPSSDVRRIKAKIDALAGDGGGA